jgi:hypothetical protein
MLIAVFSYNSYAQEDVLRPSKKYSPASNSSNDGYSIILGLEGGINLNFFSQNLVMDNTYALAGLANPTAYTAYGSGFGVSPHLALLVDFPLGNKFNGEIRIDFDERDFKKSSSGFDYDISNPLNSVPKNVNFNWEMQTFYYGLSAIIRYDINNNLFVSGGLNFQHQSGLAKETDNVSSADGITPVNNYSFWNADPNATGPTYQRVKNIGNNSNNSGNTFDNRLGLELGVGYKISLSKSVWLVPQGRFQFFLTKIVSDDNPVGLIESGSNRVLNGAQLVLALWFGL